MDSEGTVRILEALKPVLEGLSERSEEENEELFRGIAEKLDVKLGSVLMPLRVAVTGSTVSPPIIGSIKLLGEEKTLKRVEKAIEKLNGEVANG